MKITLKDGSCKEYDKAMSVYDIAKDISEGLARVACAGEVDGEFTISGTWEGKFNNGKEVYSDGQFHAVVPYASY